jgi:hypothetical protein
MSDDRQIRVSRRAYELWEQEGGEHGRHEDHWHRANAEIEDDVVVAAPDGTPLTFPADTIEGEPAKPARKRAASKGRPAVTPAAATADTPAKPRKPKTK